MTENSQPIRIDIGGGTDAPAQLLNQDISNEIELAHMYELRAVKLAQKHPDQQFYVLDISMDRSAASGLATEVPNVHFLQASGDELPIKEAVADEVEINHVFYPLRTAAATALNLAIPVKIQAERDRIVGQASRMVFSHEVDELIKPFERELKEQAEALFTEALHVLESPDSTLEDFPLYFGMVSEAARALKPGGQLKLAEKRQRIDIIERILNSPAGQNLLAQSGLKIVDTQVNTDPDMAPYADAARQTYEAVKNSDNEAEAEQYRPMVMTLEKL